MGEHVKITLNMPFFKESLTRMQFTTYIHGHRTPSLHSTLMIIVHDITKYCFICYIIYGYEFHYTGILCALPTELLHTIIVVFLRKSLDAVIFEKVFD